MVFIWNFFHYFQLVFCVHSTLEKIFITDQILDWLFVYFFNCSAQHFDLEGFLEVGDLGHAVEVAQIAGVYSQIGHITFEGVTVNYYVVYLNQLVDKIAEFAED